MATPDVEEQRLESWKQIASYLGRSERTVRRWHEQEGLPVHKHLHQQRGSVWAFPVEIDRWRDARTVRPAEEDPDPAPSREPVGAVPPAARRRWTLPVLLAFGAVVTVGLGFVSTSRRQTGRLVNPVPLTALPGQEYGASFSPGGKRAVFHWTSATPGDRGLYIKMIGADHAVPLLTRAQSAGSFLYSPAWSPTGDTIAYLERTPGNDTWLSVIDVSGRNPRRVRQVAAAPVLYYGNYSHLTWDRDGRSVVAPMDMPGKKGIVRIPLGAGSDTILVSGESLYAPALSPDGRYLAWMHKYGLPIAGEELLITRLNGAGHAAANPDLLWRGEGFSAGIAWSNDSRSLLHCAEIDRRIFHVPLRSGAPRRELGGADCSTVSSGPGGTVVFGHSVRTPTSMMRMSFPSRRSNALAPSSRHDTDPEFSPDGKRVIFTSDRSGEREIWIVQPDGSGLRRITEKSRVESEPSWSPRGTEIVYASGGALVIQTPEGERIRRIEVSQAPVQHPVWSIDGETIYYTANSRLHRIRRDGSGPAVIAELPELLDLAPSLDGRYLYFSRAGKRFHISRMPVTGGAAEVVVTGVASPYFALSRRAIYVIRQNSIERAALDGTPLESHGSLPSIDPDTQLWEARLAVTPDESDLIWVQTPRREMDIEMARLGW